LGATFRAFVAGLRSVMIARASIKGTFRIEQTMIRSRDNNPLKFSTNDDDALSGILGVGRHLTTNPTGAVAEALRDIRLHELASMAAMQAAARALVARFDPASARAASEQGSGLSLVPNHRKARAWDQYEATYDDVKRALEDDFDSVFGKAFARAYEDALEELTDNDQIRY
jgi:type VI secretion system FHA domain protein